MERNFVNQFKGTIEKTSFVDAYYLRFAQERWRVYRKTHHTV